MYNLVTLPARQRGVEYGSLLSRKNGERLMQLQPAYDPTNLEWFVELDDREITAKSLRELQVLLPECNFADYYPNGHNVVRPGFLQASDRKPLVSDRAGRAKQHQINIALHEERVTLIAAQETKEEPKKEVIERIRYVKAVKPIRTKVEYEEVVELLQRGATTSRISKLLHCTIGAVQTQKLQALRRRDERLPKSPFTNNPFKRGPEWTEEQDQQLMNYANQRLSSSQIAEKFGRTRNAIIGRCHRIGVQLKSQICGRPRDGSFV